MSGVSIEAEIVQAARRYREAARAVDAEYERRFAALAVWPEATLHEVEIARGNARADLFLLVDRFEAQGGAGR